MAKEPNITAAELRAILHYDPETGIFTWRERPLSHFAAKGSWIYWNARFSMKPAGIIDSRRYVRVSINNRTYEIHRLAWLYVTGKWPSEQIDHINLDRADNRFCNLREATRSQNSANTSKRIDNSSGAKGVYWSRKTKKWRAQIGHKGKRIHLGLFNEKEAAAAAYERAAKTIHGEFARV